MVYQDFALAGNMPIYENIYLGREPGRKFGGLTIVDRDQARADGGGASRPAARSTSKAIDQNVEDLSGGQRQAVAIARATAFDAKVVIMDEPTAALAIKEVGKVLDLIKTLKEHGVAVIIISPPHGRHLLCLRPRDGALPGRQLRRSAARQDHTATR